jgi:hypothetical protein
MDVLRPGGIIFGDMVGRRQCVGADVMHCVGCQRNRSQSRGDRPRNVVLSLLCERRLRAVSGGLRDREGLSVAQRLDLRFGRDH